MMKTAWDGYEKYAFGQNELKPISKSGHSAGIFGGSAMGASIIDALDTLYIMGLTEEYKKGREWVALSLQFSAVSFSTRNSSSDLLPCHLQKLRTRNVALQINAIR